MLSHRSLRLAVVALVVGSLSRADHACTAFVLRTGQRVLVGRNLDVSKGFTGGYLMGNPGGGSRRSVLGDSRRRNLRDKTPFHGYATRHNGGTYYDAKGRAGLLCGDGHVEMRDAGQINENWNDWPKTRAQVEAHGMVWKYCGYGKYGNYWK